MSGTNLTAKCNERGCWPWKQGEPNNHQKQEEVAAMAKGKTDGEKGLFNDIVKGWIRKGFICELVTG